MASRTAFQSSFIFLGLNGKKPIELSRKKWLGFFQNPKKAYMETIRRTLIRITIVCAGNRPFKENTN